MHLLAQCGPLPSSKQPQSHMLLVHPAHWARLACTRWPCPTLAQRATSSRISKGSATQGSLDGACPGIPQTRQCWGAPGGPHAWSCPGLSSLGCPSKRGIDWVTLGSVMLGNTSSGAALWTSRLPGSETADSRHISIAGDLLRR